MRRWIFRVCIPSLAAVLILCPAVAADLQQGGIGTVAGNGAYGYGGDGGSAPGASIDSVYALAVDALGNLYIADSWNNRVRKVTPAGTISTFAGNGTADFSGDGGPAAAAAIHCPRGIVVDGWGNVYISDTGNLRVRRVSPDGVIATVAGRGDGGYDGDGGNAVDALLNQPRGLAVDGRGRLYIADSFNFRIRIVDRNGQISTIAGNGSFGSSPDGELATESAIGMIQGVAVDRDGNVYFSDPYNHVVRRIGVDGRLFTVAGNGSPGSFGDGGDARQAQLNFPRGLACDGLGNLYVSDSFNNRIRRISSAGVITTVAGETIGFGGDQGPASSASLNYPYGLTADPRGNIFVADLRNYRVRKARFEAMSTPPSISPGGVTNAASGTSPVAPGSLISIWGSAFSYRDFAAPVTPLPRSMGGVSALIGDRQIPVLYVSGEQINAQLPWSVPVGQASLKINFGGVESAPISVPVAAGAPGVFQWGSSRAVVTNHDNTLNTESNPAVRGSWVVIYATGGGLVTPPVDDGVPAGSDPLRYTVNQPLVSFGPVAGNVLYSGLSPEFVGVWQLNVDVPATAPTGANVPLGVSICGRECIQTMVAIR